MKTKEDKNMLKAIILLLGYNLTFTVKDNVIFVKPEDIGTLMLSTIEEYTISEYNKETKLIELTPII